MVGQIILGVLGVLIGGGGLIAFVIGLVKPPKVSPEELAAFEEKKLKEKNITANFGLTLSIGGKINYEERK